MNQLIPDKWDPPFPKYNPLGAAASLSSWIVISMIMMQMSSYLLAA